MDDVDRRNSHSLAQWNEPHEVTGTLYGPYSAH